MRLRQLEEKNKEEERRLEELKYKQTKQASQNRADRVIDLDE